ncbi:hypothetical protein DL546_001314 [Coniochaeta pulveracea]|uniref:Carboxyltransferase domain-containing protein n=1 Tax=Coniochaeta pulveracea TaxID=177199 RepID=A0A420XWI8_9PEZI|nr:hypothetical protein DL546_001314 [Coniochaeta pulveracea]
MARTGRLATTRAGLVSGCWARHRNGLAGMEEKLVRIPQTTSRKSDTTCPRPAVAWQTDFLSHSYGYSSPGGVNWEGDAPCIFSVDSPNFGGLICSSTVISANLWKLGQLNPIASFRMTPVSLDDALRHLRRINRYISGVNDALHGTSIP